MLDKQLVIYFSSSSNVVDITQMMNVIKYRQETAQLDQFSFMNVALFRSFGLLLTKLPTATKLIDIIHTLIMKQTNIDM
jgi:hypothetical protein